MVSASAMFSKPVSVSSRLESWKMKPRSSRRNFANARERRPVMSRPSTRMCPLVTVSMVATQFSSVVLPEPDGPMMPTNSPGATSKLMSLMARVTESRLPYTFSIWRTDRMGRAPRDGAEPPGRAAVWVCGVA